MMRMAKMEFVIFGQYLKQMAFTMLFVTMCVAAGMGTISGMPSIAFVMVMFGMSTSGAAYDEQNGWGVYRMTMPVSRRDIVFGRYAFNFLAALLASAAMGLLMVALAMLGQTLPVSGFVADVLAWNEETAMAAIAGMVSCVCIGLSLCSVTLPAYFKFGQTKATQWLPFIMLLISVAPFLVIEFMGGAPLAMLESVVSAAQATGGFGAVGIIALGVALAAYCLSALVSVKLYEARDL